MSFGCDERRMDARIERICWQKGIGVSFLYMMGGILYSDSEQLDIFVTITKYIFKIQEASR
jgi:hypothetical protein